MTKLYFKDYFKGEDEHVKICVNACKEEFILCEEAWNYLHSHLIKSVDRQCKLFILYKEQVDIALFLALTSILRLHATQFNQNMRYAVENIEICLYFLNFPEEFNEMFLNSPDKGELDEKFEKNIRKATYDFIEEKHPKLNEAIKKERKRCNLLGSHASFTAAISNIDIKSEEKVETSIFDKRNKFGICLQLTRLTDLIIGFMQIIIEHRMDEKMLPLNENAKQEVTLLNRKLAASRQNMQKVMEGLNKDTGRNDKCWCGSDIKFKKCHGK